MEVLTYRSLMRQVKLIFLALDHKRVSKGFTSWWGGTSPNAPKPLAGTGLLPTAPKVVASVSMLFIRKARVKNGGKTLRLFQVA